MTDTDLSERSINTIRFLAADAVQNANSGHPGLPMGVAPLAYVLWTRHMIFDPHHPDWPNRDRFVLSGGHAGIGAATAAAVKPSFPIRPIRV